MCFSVEELSAYLDSDLEDPKEVEAHLPTCEECRRARDELAVMKALARESVSSPPNLWPQIAAGLAQESWLDRLVATLRAPWLVAGVAFALIAVVFTVGWPRGSGDGSEELSSARRSYSQAIEKLEAANRGAYARLPDEARIKIEESLALVDREIAACEEVLRAAPGDALGQKLLLSLYDEKVRVLDAALAASDREEMR